MLEIYLSKVRKVKTKIRSNNACIVTINTKPTKYKYCDFRVKDKTKINIKLYVLYLGDSHSSLLPSSQHRELNQ